MLKHQLDATAFLWMQWLQRQILRIFWNPVQEVVGGQRQVDLLALAGYCTASFPAINYKPRRPLILSHRPHTRWLMLHDTPSYMISPPRQSLFLNSAIAILIIPNSLHEVFFFRCCILLLQSLKYPTLHAVFVFAVRPFLPIWVLLVSNLQFYIEITMETPHQNLIWR